jgi:RimJ/RimL family protein N-acetyltransferase
MTTQQLMSDRLRLVPVTVETCIAELEKSPKLSALLDADIPGCWPPPLVTEETLHQFISMLQADEVRLCSWYWIQTSRILNGRDILIGGGGLFTNDDNSCELGYSVLTDFQNHGYATEAVKAILTYAFSVRDVEQIYAHTYPYLVPSVRVLQKSGFLFNGPGKEEGTIQFLITRKTAD